ncbi:MAG: hypothetical protein IKN11_09230 [Bacteroidales bacterium]|nr:hypothetical protein [Bacteroidales bacterium]
MATIQVGGSLRPRSSLNTPLDERTVIASLSLMQGIPLPYVGMLVYCLEDGKYYKVTALNQDQDTVASYEEFPNPSQGGSSFSGSYNDLTDKPVFATVGGQRIDQGGNIPIEGGGSEPSAPVEVPHSGTAVTIATLDGGTLHTCSDPLASLAVTAYGQNTTAEAVVLFETGQDWTGLTMPQGTAWAPMRPMPEAGRRYVLAVQNGIATLCPVES